MNLCICIKYVVVAYNKWLPATLALSLLFIRPPVFSHPKHLPRITVYVGINMYNTATDRGETFSFIPTVGVARRLWVRLPEIST